MSEPGNEPQGNGPQGGEPQSTEQQNTPPASDTIGLSRAEYQELLTAAAVGQQLAAQAQQAQQAQQQQRQRPAPQNHMPQLSQADIDRLSNSQLMQVMQHQAMAPVVQQVMNMQVKFEVAECRAEFPDFADYQADTIRIASDNTSLSLREAYLLAKAHKGSHSKPNQATAPTPKPSTQTTTPPPSLKPGPAPVTAQPAGTMSTRDAALAALKELKYE